MRNRLRASVVLVVLLAALSSGCASEWQVHATVATSVRSFLDASRTILFQRHDAAVLEIRRAIVCEGEPACAARRDEAGRAASRMWREQNTGLVDAYNVLAAASNAYNVAAVGAIEGDLTQRSTLEPLAREVREAANVLLALARSEGVNVPDIPPELVDLVLSFATSGGEGN